MDRSYSTYDAKAKFSEILRQVRSGRRVLITYRGETVAEVRPVEAPTGIEERILRAEESGVVEPSAGGHAKMRPLAKRPGGLKRFLESRD